MLVTGIALLLASGHLQHLSLARELAARQSQFIGAVTTHLQLVALALLVALPLGGALGVLAAARPTRAPALFSLLNLLQTIPSIALFALLIGPLTSLTDTWPWLRTLGISGIGTAPAVIALS